MLSHVSEKGESFQSLLSKTKRQIQMSGNMITKYLTGKGQQWPLFVVYTINIFASVSLGGFSRYELLFVKKPPGLTNVMTLPIEQIVTEYTDYVAFIKEKSKICYRYSS